MAKKKEETKTVMERTYNVPLRKEWLKSPRYKRSKKAISALKEFLIKHTKSDTIKIGKYANLELWKHGIKNPPHHIKVNVTKDSEGVVTAEIVGAPKEKIEEPKKAKKEEPKKEEKKPETKAEKKIEDLKEKKEEKQEKAKEIEKEEIKELKEEEKPTEKPTPKENPKQEITDKAPKADQGIARGERRDKA